MLPGLTNTLATAPQSEEQKRGTWEQQAIKPAGRTGMSQVQYFFNKRLCGIYHWRQLWLTVANIASAEERRSNAVK